MRGRLALLLLAAPLMAGLTGCGLQPIYADGSQGVAAQQLAGIEVPLLPERAGQLLRDELLRVIRPDGQVRYRLDIKMAETIEGFGIRGDESVARKRVSLVADYQLVDIASNQVVLADRARADAGIDVVQSEYAVVAAEQTARERNATVAARAIAARLGLHFRTSGPAAAGATR